MREKNNWSEFFHTYICQIPECEFIINKQKQQIDKKSRRQNHIFSTRIPYAEGKIREIHFAIINTKNQSTEGMIKKLQIVKNNLNLIKLFVFVLMK